MSKPRYINFPISLLKNAANDIHKACSDILSLALYEFCMNKDGSKEKLIAEAEEYYDIKFDDWNQSLSKGQVLFEKLPGRIPRTGVTITMIEDFRLNLKSKFEIETFLGFCAVRSIIQTQPFRKITDDFLLARMAGAPSAKGDFSLPEVLQKYKIRYHINKLKDELQNSWGLKIYGYKMRGYYVSYKLDLKVLGLKAESLRKSKIASKKRKERREVINEIQMEKQML